uniref:HCO3_cotransp domain-containing protein n=1 Tax=Parastrongyloides trichosuri TaxID=131310 RepID=A0A0N4ZME0_PARTI
MSLETNNIDKNSKETYYNQENERILLLLRSNTVHQPKIFHEEIRGKLDIKNYISNASIIINEKSTSFQDILINIVSEISFNNKLKTLSYHNDVKEKLFNHTHLSSPEGDEEVLQFKNLITSLKINGDNIFMDQRCLTLYCNIDNLNDIYIGITKLEKPTNFGPSLESLQFISLILTPTMVKETKKSFEIAKTIGTIMSYDYLRLNLEKINNKKEFRDEIISFGKNLIINNHIIKKKDNNKSTNFKWRPILCIIDDFRCRWKHYPSDFYDGIVDYYSINKSISSTVYLFLTILLTTIALGMLNDENTNSLFGVKQQILSQIIGGIFFAITGGQLFLVVLSTAPISICISIIYQISIQYNFNFYHLYTWIGIYTSSYLLILSLVQASFIMKYAKQSLEELFGLFISFALIIKSSKAILFSITRYDKECHNPNDILSCDRSSGLLFIMMVFGTFFISMWLFSFRLTNYLKKFFRNFVADYSLPVAILIMTILAQTIFKDIPKETFTFNENSPLINITKFWNLSQEGHLLALQLAIPIAILFFMDQLIVTRTVDNDANNLKKGSSVNWDLFIVSILNCILSILNLPWMHGALPQSYLHLRALADVEERIVDGVSIEVITKNRESRLSILLSHILMIPTFFFFISYFKLIPVSVYHGLFLNMAFTSMIGNKLIDRILLIFTQQHSYPPTNYIRKVPQFQVHLFTIIEIIQLLLLICVGFSGKPFLELSFPLITFLFIPLRLWILPLFFNKTTYLHILDGKHQPSYLIL